MIFLFKNNIILFKNNTILFKNNIISMQRKQGRIFMCHLLV